MDFDPIKWQRYIRKWRKQYYAQSDDFPSMTDFAKVCNISPQVMSNWDLAKLKKRPSADQYLKLVPLFGNEVFEALDLPVPSNDIDILALFAPPDLVNSIKEARIEYSSELAKRGMETDSPEARRIVIEAFEKRGIKVNVTE